MKGTGRECSLALPPKPWRSPWHQLRRSPNIPCNALTSITPNTTIANLSRPACCWANAQVPAQAKPIVEGQSFCFIRLALGRLWHYFALAGDDEWARLKVAVRAQKKFAAAKGSSSCPDLLPFSKPPGPDSCLQAQGSTAAKGKFLPRFPQRLTSCPDSLAFRQRSFLRLKAVVPAQICFPSATSRQILSRFACLQRLKVAVPQKFFAAAKGSSSCPDLLPFSYG